jgi:Flp pilus assembly protein TadD
MALEIYPGFAASYRGLGAAYDKQGDVSKALVAYRTYVKAAPNARDSGAVLKRIDKLVKAAK